MSRLSGLARRAVAPPSLPDKLKGGRLERYLNFWQNLARDYKEATLDIGKWAQQKPLKASMLGVVAGFALFANNTNPNDRAFNDFMVRVNQDVLMVPASCRNSASADWLTQVSRLAVAGQLRAWNFGLLTIMWRADYSQELGHIKVIIFEHLTTLSWVIR